MKKYFTVERLVEENPLSLQTEDRIIASEIQMDYNTIIMSPEFRRMQDKTQVFPLSRGDFVRTRLTHSYEVSIIAEQIARYSILYLDTKQPEGYDWDDEDKERFVDLAKTSGLLHDIGNPPFGHFGETCIRNWFEDNQKRVLCLDKEGNKVYFKELLSTSKTGYPLYEDLLLYDGNVQGLRIILKADSVQEGQNMNFVQSLIHSMVKYPYDSKTAKTLDSKKCGYNHAEKRAFEKVMTTTQSKNPRHVVTYILEAADDIAYRCADIEDAFQKGVITFYDIKRYLSEYLDKNLKYDLRVYNLFNHYYEKAMDDQHHAVEYMRLWLAEVRIFLMKHVAHQFANDFTAIESGKVHKYELTEECYGKNFFHFAQNLTKDLIYTSNIVLDLEVASKACMYDLLELFVDAVIAHDNHIEITTANGDVGTPEPTYYQQKLIKLIPAEYTQRYKNERSDTDEIYNLYLRVLCVLDYISSMTDRFAYEKRNTLMGLNI